MSLLIINSIDCCYDGFCTMDTANESHKIITQLKNYQALLWWIFQTGKFLREKPTLI